MKGVARAGSPAAATEKSDRMTFPGFFDYLALWCFVLVDYVTPEAFGVSWGWRLEIAIFGQDSARIYFLLDVQISPAKTKAMRKDKHRSDTK